MYKLILGIVKTVWEVDSIFSVYNAKKHGEERKCILVLIESGFMEGHDIRILGIVSFWQCFAYLPLYSWERTLLFTLFSYTGHRGFLENVIFTEKGGQVL